jgi:hypothetical protein
MEGSILSLGWGRAEASETLRDVRSNRERSSFL